MAKLDRLGWTAGISIRCFGLPIGIRVNVADAVEGLAPLLPPGWKPLPTPEVRRLYSLRIGGEGPRPGLRGFHLLYLQQLQIARALDLSEVLQVLESDLQLYVAEKARRRVFVHAGVVEWNGRAILLPGRSMSGKSTLVEALVRRGARYYSDEYAVLDERAMVHPYARPLSLRRSEGRPAQRIGSDALGAKVGGKPLPVGLVVVTEFRPDTRWRPRRLSPGRSILELMANTVPARRRSQGAITIFRKLVSTAPVLRGARGDVEGVADALLGRATPTHAAAIEREG